MILAGEMFANSKDFAMNFAIYIPSYLVAAWKESKMLQMASGSHSIKIWSLTTWMKVLRNGVLAENYRKWDWLSKTMTF